jgi:predicted sulfurtransferase
VRCERASAYMKSKGVTDLYQLSGGIHRYQEAYPHGGYFKGKNFVYDPRRALPYEHHSETIGRCRYCDCCYDDYSPETRCKVCRVLQLVCPTCLETNQSYHHHGIVCQACDSMSNGYQRKTPALFQACSDHPQDSSTSSMASMLQTG